MKLVNITINQQLLDKLDNERRRKSIEENRDISRSSYIQKILRLALNNQ